MTLKMPHRRLTTLIRCYYGPCILYWIQSLKASRIGMYTTWQTTSRVLQRYSSVVHTINIYWRQKEMLHLSLSSHIWYARVVTTKTDVIDWNIETFKHFCNFSFDITAAEAFKMVKQKHHPVQNVSIVYVLPDLQQRSWRRLYTRTLPSALERLNLDSSLNTTVLQCRWTLFCAHWRRSRRWRSIRMTPRWGLLQKSHAPSIDF